MPLYYLCESCEWFSSGLQAGDSPLPVDLRNDVREYHCIKAYLVCKQDRLIVSFPYHQLSLPIYLLHLHLRVSNPWKQTFNCELLLHCCPSLQDANDAFNTWFQHFHHRRPVRVPLYRNWLCMVVWCSRRPVLPSGVCPSTYTFEGQCVNGFHQLPHHVMMAPISYKIMNHSTLWCECYPPLTPRKTLHRNPIAKHTRFL